MPRPAKDGSAARPPRKQTLTELLVKKVRPEAAAFNVWDAKERGLLLRVQPSGHRAFKFVYSRRGKPRWYHIGAVGLSDARRIAARIRLEVAEGKDPVSERRAERSSSTFAEVAKRYLEEHAKRRNKSWEQADYLVRTHLLPRWSSLNVKSITRADVRASVANISPSVANQTLAAASAIFSWAAKQEILEVNPVKGVERHEARSRERILSDAEIPRFWSAFGSAGLVRSAILKTILLTGQRPGEVIRMRREHIKDGWWEMPGASDVKSGWKGTKNSQSHRIWLAEPVCTIIAALDDATTGFVFAGERGKSITELDAAMRSICSSLGIEEKATPHDLRRSFSTMVTRLGFGREALNRVTNHKEGGIATVYDRHHYATENQRIMEAVAVHILVLAEGLALDQNVVILKR